MLMPGRGLDKHPFCLVLSCVFAMFFLRFGLTQVPEEVDANEEFPLTPSKVILPSFDEFHNNTSHCFSLAAMIGYDWRQEYYSSKHGDCFQVGEDVPSLDLQTLGSKGMSLCHFAWFHPAPRLLTQCVALVPPAP